VPAAKMGIATIRIYDVVGEKVRTLNLGTPAADAYAYVAWDGRNDAGNKVASGVYLGVLDVGGARKFWKMAVIK
jgi:flagellar hook assembly protein FlgD